MSAKSARPHKSRLVRQTSRQQEVLVCLLAVGCALFLALVYLISPSAESDAALRGLPLDDSWIHLDYARSLAQGLGFSYNPGYREAGLSSPLWALLLGLGHASLVPTGISPQWVAKGASLLIALTIPVATYLLVLRLGLGKIWGWLAAFLVALDPNLTYGSVSGMEVTLATLLILIAVLLALKGQVLGAGLTLGGLVITRAEGVPIALLIGGGLLVRKYLERTPGELILLTKYEVTSGLKLFLPALVLGGSWALLNYSVNGTFLPNTYYVKHGFHLGYFAPENLWALASGYLRHLPYFSGLMAVFSLTAIVAVLLNLIRSRSYFQAGLLLGIPISQLYLFSINIPLSTEGPWIYYTRRYMDFLIPFWCILLVFGTQTIWSNVAKKGDRLLTAVVPAAVLAMLGILGFNLVRIHGDFVREYYEDTRRVETVDVAIGKWVAANLPTDATIGITEAGAVRYFAHPDQTIIDFLGLNCHVCVGQPPQYIIEVLQPDYLILFRPAIPDSLEFEELYAMNTYPDQRGAELVVLKLN